MVIFCDLGYYIDIIFNFVCDICSVGKYCIIGFNFQVCFVGFYCFEGIGYVWQFCLVGIFNLSIGLFNLIECIQCDGGFYCDVINLTVVAG